MLLHPEDTEAFEVSIDHLLFSGPMLPVLVSSKACSLVHHTFVGCVKLLLVICMLKQFGLHTTS